MYVCNAHTITLYVSHHNTYIHTYTYVHMYVCAHMYLLTCVCMCVHVPCIHMCLHVACLHVCTYVHMYVGLYYLYMQIIRKDTAGSSYVRRCR